MLNSIIFRLGLRYINRRLFQSALFVLGVALGVAVVIAVDLANNSANRAFGLSSESITGQATHQIIGGPTGIPTEIYTQLRRELGIRNSAPVVTETVRVVELDNQPFRILGVDPFAEPPFRTYLSTVEVQDQNQDAFTALNRFIAEPGTALLSVSKAEQFGVQVGDVITLRIGANPTQVTVIGLLKPNDDLSRQALDDLLITDIGTAQEILQSPDRLTRIDLILSNQEVNTLGDFLPTGISLVDAQSGNALEQMTEAFELNLQALSLLAVVVGLFLIYNTVTFSVVQRRPVIGIMRSLGATKNQIFAFVLSEAIILSIIGTVLGLALGIIMGRFTVQLVSQTISDLYFTVNVQKVFVSPFTLTKGVFIGLVASIGTAIVPSYDATRTLPAGTLQRSSLEQQTRKLVPYITITAFALNILGYLLLQLPTTNIGVSFTALFAIILGGALFTPLLLIWGMQFFTPITSKIFGVLGRMAPRAVTRSLSRTSVAVAALTIAVSVIVGVGVMIGSFRGTVANWLENTLGADIYISPPALTANRATVDVTPEILDLVAHIEGVTQVSSSRAVSVLMPDYPDFPPANLLATDFDISLNQRRMAWNNTNTNAIQAELDNGRVMVSEPFAFRRDITPENNIITLLTDKGNQTFEVFGVFYDYSTDQGSIYMSRATYNQYFDDPFISSLAAFVEKPTDIDSIISQLGSETLADYDLIIQSNRDLREGVFEVFDRTFTITIALQILATVVAFIGILSALMALQLEHTREYGVMRATGMTNSQLRLYTLIQTGLMGIIAGVLALPIGFILALILIYVINVRSFGWTMQLALTPDDFVTAFGVAIIAALVAGIYPAWKLTKIIPAQALRSE